jgi:hypothetical protein
MKTIAQQVQAMRRHWPGFEVAGRTADQAAWFGSLVGIERVYRVMVEYRLPHELQDHERYKSSPLVRVLSPPLRPRFDAGEEAPLPHVYFDDHDITLSPLCLFDPDKDEWTPNDLIALTTIPWTADWLACYEGWLATGRWYGGGRHATREPKEMSQ